MLQQEILWIVITLRALFSPIVL